MKYALLALQLAPQFGPDKADLVVVEKEEEFRGGILPGLQVAARDLHVMSYADSNNGLRE